MDLWHNKKPIEISYFMIIKANKTMCLAYNFVPKKKFKDKKELAINLKCNATFLSKDMFNL